MPRGEPGGLPADRDGHRGQPALSESQSQGRAATGCAGPVRIDGGRGSGATRACDAVDSEPVRWLAFAAGGRAHLGYRIPCAAGGRRCPRSSRPAGAGEISGRGSADAARSCSAQHGQGGTPAALTAREASKEMKVVLFCGGLGTRLREHSDTIPKPLVNIGYRPVLWHLMRYYAHYGHTDFVLCLGYRGDMIREYFLNYSEAMTNDFTLSGGRDVELMSRDLEKWRITFVDTGLHSNIGQRLLRVKKYVENEDVFLANYSDGISDLPLDALISDFTARKVVASFASVTS